MNPCPTKRVRQNIYTGVRYEHVYTPEEQKEYYNRVTDGENPSRVIAEIDKKLKEEDWILITEE